MTRARRPTPWLVACVALAVGCAHGAFRSRPPSRAAQRFMAEAAQIRAIPYEEDYAEARMVYQALPLGSPERAALRRKLLEYLVGPIARMDPERARKDPSYLGSGDEHDRALEAFREALELLVAPIELWTRGEPRLDAAERALLGHAARTVVALFSPRGNESAVATGLFVLATLEPGQRAWQDRLQQLFGWLDAGSQLSIPGGGGRGSLPSTTDVLDSVARAWPAPAVVDRLSRLAVERQQRVAGALRRPLGTGARSALSELLIDSEALQAMGAAVASLHLRCGQIEGALAAVSRLAGKPGDDPELRQLLSATARSRGAEDYLALARRFLPRNEPFEGTSSDRLDPAAAAEVIRLGLARHPGNVELTILGGRVARATGSPYLSIRYLEEAQAILAGRRLPDQRLAEVESELAALSFARMRLLARDPLTLEPAAREAQTLRQRFAELRRRVGADKFKLRDGDIDQALAEGYMDAGQLERAEPLFQRARGDTEGSEVASQIGKLLLKRGEPARAIEVLREAMAVHQKDAPAEETIPFVEGQSRLAQMLGDAHDLGGNAPEAARAWTLALRGWERLMLFMRTRKNPDGAAESTVEVARLLYQLGRRDDALQKFSEALDHNEARGQSYIDALVFLVPRGETEAALDIYRRLLARPGREMNEYFKVYASLWILDLTRRSNKAPDPTAEAYLRSLETRRVQIRPRRDAAWYLPLARYAVGRLPYDQLAALANTPGRRAELYFYEAMRRLAEGKSDDAHDLWNKVLETKMVSFIEFEMAARYLRKGAPSKPRPEVRAGEGVSI